MTAPTQASLIQATLTKASSCASTQQQIVIVGGGMVGLSLALMLANRLPDNIAITLIEKFPFPVVSKQDVSAQKISSQKVSTQQAEENIQQESFDARSTAISAGSATILASIDCWSSLAQYAEPINDIHISDRGHYGSTQLHAQEYDVDALGYVVENQHLGRCLLQQLPNTRVQCIAPATVERCQLTQQSANVFLADTSSTEHKTLSADLLIIADGADSPICRAMGISSEKTAYQQSAIIANVALANPHKGIAYERFTDQGPLALLPLADFQNQYRAAVVWTRKSDQADLLMQKNAADFLADLQHTMGYRAGSITAVGERHAYPLTLVQSTEQVRSRVVVMGNAAHFLHPVAGQGFNLSLRDCEALAETLADVLSDGFDDTLKKNSTTNIGALTHLQRYIARRETDQQRTIGLTNAMVKTFSTASLSRSIFRQCGLLSLHTMPAAKKILARQMMGLA